MFAWLFRLFAPRHNFHWRPDLQTTDSRITATLNTYTW
jgi:hypothetical protein